MHECTRTGYLSLLLSFLFSLFFSIHPFYCNNIIASLLSFIIFWHSFLAFLLFHSFTVHNDRVPMHSRYQLINIIKHFLFGRFYFNFNSSNYLKFCITVCKFCKLVLLFSKFYFELKSRKTQFHPFNFVNWSFLDFYAAIFKNKSHSKCSALRLSERSFWYTWHFHYSPAL